MAIRVSLFLLALLACPLVLPLNPRRTSSPSGPRSFSNPRSGVASHEHAVMSRYA